MLDSVDSLQQHRRPVALVVDTEGRETKELLVFLEGLNFEVIWAKDGEVAYNVIDEYHLDIMVAELKVQRIDGMRLLQIAKERNPEICVVMIAQQAADIGLAVEAMRQGAYDFQTKPLNLAKLAVVLQRGIMHQSLVLEHHELHRAVDERFGLPNVVGRSPQMIEAYNKIRLVAPTRTTVLITGPTGAGKEVAARAIHENSPRKNAPFVTLNCAALTESLVESELFGHVKGAFTGAVAARPGRFEVADGGTLLVDEVGEISLPVQSKLLRVLEEKKFERVGETAPRTVDVRLIAATNRDLEERVREGRFREDLYYRLKVVTIHIPPLRHRKEDIPLLLDTFLKQSSKENGKKVMGISRGAMNQILKYDWPGNVRELKNCIEGMVVLAGSRKVLDVSDLPESVRTVDSGADEIRLQVGMTMEEVEKEVIQKTLEAAGFDKEKTAEMLQMGLRTLYRKMKQYQI